MSRVKIKIALFILVVIYFLTAIYFNRSIILRGRADENSLNVKLALQGGQKNGGNIKGKFIVANSQKTVISILDQDFIHEKDNIYKASVNLEGNFDFTGLYAIYVKPEKYIGKVFYPQVFFHSGANDFDLSQEIILSGDLPPQNGKVDAEDLSRIIADLGKSSKSILATDINGDYFVGVDDLAYALYSLSKNAHDDEIVFVEPSPTITASPTPSPKPSPTIEITARPTAEPTQAPMGLIRPQKNLDQVLSLVAKETCVPKGLLLAISSNENGLKFQNIDEARFTLFNTFNWWNKDTVTKEDLCFGMVYNTYDGNIPQDSKFPGEFCFPSPGDPDDEKIMGPVPISEREWEAYKNNINKILGQTTTDRRIMLDAHLALGFHLKNISTYRGNDCDNWELKYMAKAACKYLGKCTYTDGLGRERNYCIDMCNNYNKFQGTNLDCNSIPSIISEYEQCKIN